MAKRKRRFTREFKLGALAKLEQASSVTGLADELGIRREMLHKWRRAYEEGGAEALHTIGRPEGSPASKRPARPSDPAADRIAELERLVGQQQADLDFFRAALQRVEARRRNDAGTGGTTSSR
jgi:transposase